MDVNENHVQTLLSMGFPNDGEIRRALRMSKNDLNDAVAVLTNDHVTSNYDTLEEYNVEMKDFQSGNNPVYGPTPPPAYEESIETDKNNSATGEVQESVSAAAPVEESDSLEFPVTNLYELEGRVFTEQWSIPYKKEESFGKCLIAAARLASADLSEGDEHCRRFLDRCMPEAFQKLLSSGAVHRWGTEIQEGIYNMCELLIDLVVARLQFAPVPIHLLDVLTLTFNPDCEFHIKNKTRRCDRNYKFDENCHFAILPTNLSKDPRGWLLDLVNRFAYNGGFSHIQKLLEKEDLDAPSRAALLKPLGICSEYLNGPVVEIILSHGIKLTYKYVQDLEEKDFKEKKVGSVSDLLASMKLLCLSMWQKDVSALDRLRLDIALRMLKSPHFNAKMNSLKEVTKLIEDATSSKAVKTAIQADKIVDWLVENKVLSIGLEGNIDQAQYCDKIRGIVDFLGTKLSAEELSMIWKMQNGQTNNVIDNIHSIVAAAAVKFETKKLEQLFFLIQKKWRDDNDRMREKLLSLIGKIGKDAKVSQTTTQVLELLWDLAHLPALSTQLTEQALEEHLAILSDAYIVKDQVKKQYALKCVDDIKKGVWVLPALKQLLHISKSLLKANFQKDKSVLHELNKSDDVIKLVSHSLVKCHRQAVSGTKNGLTQYTLVDNRYTHSEYVTTHLKFLQYVLQEGVLFLHWNRARDIWSTLVANPEACNWDRETCYEWFNQGLADLEPETQSQLFQKELLRLDPNKLSEKGFNCVNNFFTHVNMYEHRLKKTATSIVVEKMDLCGLDFLWEVCLNTPDENIAENAIHLLLNMCYTNLAPRLKRDPINLHKKFIQECSTRLEAAIISIGGTVVAQAISSATRTLTAAIASEVANIPMPSRSVKLLNIERLLWIAETYVLSVEQTHTVPRIILPHGASFHGTQLRIHVSCESPKQDFSITCHSNETLSSARQKIADQLKHSPEHVQIVANDRMLSPGKDQKLLQQLDLEDNQTLSVRLFTASSSQSTSNASKEIQDSPQLDQNCATQTSKQLYDLEQEKMLPGVVMAAGGQVFEMVYQLAELDERKITARVRKLLMLIPTDPAISDILDAIGQKGLKPSTSSDDLSPRSSPKKSLSASLSNSRTEPKEMLKTMFDVMAADMSAFRVLYNLEVLSSKLMPIGQDVATRQSSHSFCDDFLNNGGLSLVVSVLQQESMPPDVCYEMRQGCYAICLQLARFLLCGQTVTGDLFDQQAVKEEPKGAGVTTVTIVTDDSHVTAGGRAIKTMGVHDFTETVSCFMRVTWAAAAGRLHLISSSQPIRESSSGYGPGRRSRQSSTGSSGSASSENEGQSLHAGVCGQQASVPTKDNHIAQEALEILITCLQLRNELIASFYSLPCVSDFIIDLLVSSPQADMRQSALEKFYLLSKTELTMSSDTPQPSPHQFLLQVLLKAYLPFWVSSTTTRGASQRLLNQCSQYFELRCRLLTDLSVADQSKFQIDINSMLEDELAWLQNFVASENLDLRDIDNYLLGGHLNLICTLFTCEGVRKEEFGSALVNDLIHEFLFPASLLKMQTHERSKNDNTLQNFNPKCSNSESRVASYSLLVELVSGSLENLTAVCNELISMHHKTNPDGANEWEYQPLVDPRALCGYVGLKNGGATCYMNSVIQQLYMVPGIPESVLGIDQDKPDEESVFYQIQHVFGHLLESRLQYHEPDKFWKIFKLWGQSINIREQQDAFDFFQALIDQVDEHMKKFDKEEIFKKKFQGIFSDQKICKDCPHRYEREEAFSALNLTVKNATLQDSLDQFVKGELLEGDNAYFCEKCGEKRNTIKRMCIKTLPPLLCIQLKRFGYDWEANRALKFDDFFRFPWLLDMEPYTADGMTRQEDEHASSSLDADFDLINGDLDPREPHPVPMPLSHSQINYELVGIVVHSGQANAGHYYSLIKDRRICSMSNPNRRKWFKFNDTFVEEFEMNDSSLEAECFGGAYKANVYDQSASSYPEERVRYWNGYMLFYERIEAPSTPISAKKSKMITKKTIKEGGKGRLDSDSLIELQELVHKGEKRGIFLERMPASVQQEVWAENLNFVKNRDIYNNDYFHFISNLAAKNAGQEKHKEYPEMCIKSLELAIKFLFNTYFRTRKKLRSELDNWVEIVDTLVCRSKQACMWMMDYLASEEGSSYIKPFLVECPNRDVRWTIAQLVNRTMAAYLDHGGVTTQKNMSTLLETLLQMLNKDVPDNCKHCFHYFMVLRNYVQMGTKACTHMFGCRAFQRIMNFLLGPTVGNGDQNGARRWSSLQARDFGYLHTALATLILNSDVSSFQEGREGYPVHRPLTVNPNIYLKMSAEMQNYVFGTESSRYLREVVQAVREITSTSSSLATILDMVQYCCFCNWGFSLTILKLIMLQYMSTPSNELKPIFSLLAEVLILEDPLQMKRIQLVIEGHIDEHGLQHEGMLTVIRLNHVSDSRRSYQCIKFLVNLANKCPLAKDYLMQTPSKWQWAVNWLRKKMADYWSPSTTLSNEDSNRKSFQRTVSAQDTLAEATALLSELEGSGSEMDICGPSTGETEADSESQSQQDSQMTEDYDEETYQRNSQMS